MRFPFVSRDRYDEAVVREARLQKKLDEAHDTLLDMVDKLVALKSQIVEHDITGPPEPEPGFALPPKVKEAIYQRAPRGSKIEGELRRYAEKRLANGEAEAEVVAKEILAGSDAFADEAW